MGVLNGQPVNQSITNAAFINKNVADQDPNQLDFTSAQTGFGPSVINIQKCVNAIFSFVGTVTSSAYNALPAWVTNNFGTPTDTLFARVEAIDAAFTAASGSRATRAGVVTAATGVTAITASFSSPFSDTNYAVTVAFINQIDAYPIFMQSMITYKSASGFVVTMNAPTDSVNYSMNYIASRFL